MAALTKTVRARLGRVVPRQEGLTLVEVLVAALVLVLGSMAVFMTFSASIRNVQRGKETQVGVSVAQREMEAVRALDYGEVALTATPQPAGGAGGPGGRVRDGEFNLSRAGNDYAPLWVTGEGPSAPAVEPGPEELASIGGVKVAVYRFVVCEPGQEADGTCRAKRVVIDVLPSESGGTGRGRAYYELQATIVNPEGPGS